MDADKEREEIEKIHSEIGKLNDSYSQKLGNLKEAIRSGNASSKDKIIDFVTAYFGMWDSKTTSPYRELEKQINENIGGEVLVIKKETSESEMRHMLDGIGCMEEPVFYSSKIELQLGAISNQLELDVQTGEIIIPTKSHAKAKIECCSDDIDFFPEKTGWEKIEGEIKNKYDELRHLFGEPVKNWLSFYSGGFSRYCPKLTSEIIIGKEVEKYFKKIINGEKSYSEARVLLNPHLEGRLF
ncbi:MAG: hypothetical protein PHH54_00490 [Candidatus Nanoarchaeia archaeon]|nr:hypothetical protein [Candidatus Nanoarchaeia archaeon]MDD5740441.1 hypothetical protein [Candidatus Nanoarchaeia archaeon]